MKTGQAAFSNKVQNMRYECMCAVECSDLAFLLKLSEMLTFDNDETKKILRKGIFMCK